jgi:hypothetical protein
MLESRQSLCWVERLMAGIPGAMMLHIKKMIVGFRARRGYD